MTRRGARPRLLARAAGPARQARGRDLEAAHGQVPLLVDLPRRGGGADAQPVRAAARERLLVRDRPRPRARRHPDVPRLAHPLRHPVRHAARARLPPAAGVRRRELPRPGRVAVRRHRRRGADRGRARHRLVGRARLRRASATSVEGDVFVTEYASSTLLARWILRQDGRADPARAVRAPPARRSRAPARRAAPTRARRPTPAAEVVAEGQPDARRALRRPGRAGALRRAAVAARLPARRLRRRARGRDPGAGARRPLLDPAPSSSRSTSRCSTSSTSAAAATRSTPSCTATRCTSTRSSSATRSAAPPRLTPLEARAIRLALEFVGPDGRRRRALAARPRAREARGDVRRVRARPRRPTPHVGEEEGLVDTLTQAIDEHKLVEIEYLKPEEQEVVDAHRRAVLDRAPPAALVRPHVGRRPRPAALLPPRPDAEREGAAQELRPARGLRPVRAAHGDERAHLVLAGRRALGGREGRASARRRLRGRRQVGRQRRVAGRRGGLLPRRGNRARARRAPGAGRARAHASSAVELRPQDGQRQRERRPRGRGAEETSSVPPCASAIERAM